MVSKRIVLYSKFFIENEEYRPIYLNNSPILTVGTKSLLMMSLGRSCTDEVAGFLIRNEEHLSTRFVYSPSTPSREVI